MNYSMESLESRYLNYCKRHKVLPNPAIMTSLSRVEHQKSIHRQSSLMVVLDHLKDADLLPLIDTINTMCISDVDVIDIHNESPCILNEDRVLSLMCAANQKLQTVSLQNLPFTKRFLRYLFQSGLCCQVLKLSSSTLRKLDMVGGFMQLRKLNLDFCTSLTTLQKDCFSHMPNLMHLSMCETRIANLWTTTAALSKLPSLVELRFQNCLCCEDTGPCPAYPSKKFGIRVSNSNHLDGETNASSDHLQNLSLLELSSDLKSCLEKALHDVSNLQDGYDNDLSEGLNNLTARKKYISHHPSPICFEKHYREFLIASLPQLEVLDNLPVGRKDKKLAQEIYSASFEYLPYRRHAEESISRILYNREIASSGPFRRPFKSSQSSLRKNQHSFSRSLCAAKLGASAWPLLHSLSNISCITNEESKRFRPRQFEYHPSDSSLMAFGTLDGEIVVINHENAKEFAYMPPLGGGARSILGLCWLKKYPSKVLAGSDNGMLRLYDISNTLLKGDIPYYGEDLATSHKFDNLTSVHINSTDELVLVSGYTRNVALYDMGAGKRLELFTDLHRDPINVAKFSNLSPFMFATSSFDHDVKMWDIRQKMVRPCFTSTSSRGNVMVCFSPDDHYLLVSAVDNEVKQLLAVDGRLHTDFGIASSGSAHNYTRSYYMNGRDYIISGSSDEPVVRICCAQTGRRLRDVCFEGKGSDKAMYVQSLRSDPFRPFNMSILGSWAQSNSRCEIIKVNLLSSSEDGEDYCVQQSCPSFSLGG